MNFIKTIVYLDILLLVNFVIALFLLLSTGLLCGQSCKTRWLVCGAVAAALATLILFAQELPFWLQCLYKGASALCCVKLCYPQAKKRLLLRLVAWYFLLNLVLAGFVAAVTLQSSVQGAQTNNLTVYLYISPSILILCVGGVYLCLKVLLYCFETPGANTYCDVGISCEEETFCVTLFFDTGFSVNDLFSNRKVILLNTKECQNLLPDRIAGALSHLSALLHEGQTTDYDATVPIRFIECSTIAGKALLPAIAVGAVWNVKTPQQKEEDILLAFCEEGIFPEGCSGLFGENLASVLLEKERATCTDELQT